MDAEILSLFETGQVSIALKKDGVLVYQHLGRGIRPALDLLDSHPDLLRGADVFDLIVGKAAASVFILGGARSVFAFTISDSAIALLQAHGVPCGWRTRTDQIINRTGTGLCPFEQSVLTLETPEACLPVIRDTLNRITKTGGQ